MDQIADAVVGPIETVMRDEIMKMLKHLKIGKAPWPFEVYVEKVLASEDIVIRVLMELCQRILDGRGMPADSATIVAIPI